MPDGSSVKRGVRGGASRARSVGQGAFDRLTNSVEAAQVALKDLRAELGRGSRHTLADLDRTLKDARKDLRSLSRTVSKDLAQIQEALVNGKPVTRRASAHKSAAGRTTSQPSTRSTGTRTTAAKAAGKAATKNMSTSATRKAAARPNASRRPTIAGRAASGPRSAARSRAKKAAVGERVVEGAVDKPAAVPTP